MKQYYSKVMVLLCMLIFGRSYAIEPTWGVDFGSVLDNREGDGKIIGSKTYFFTTLAPEAGLRFTGQDRISGGVVWTQPLENGVKDGEVVPTLYYRHDSDKWSFSVGMFPRKHLREELPGFLWSDSLSYFQKNIRGALVQYNHKNGYFDAYIDWRQKQTETKREAFNIVFHGEWCPKSDVFMMGTYLMMNHFAKTRNPDPEQRVVDNFLVNPYIGFDFGGKTAFRSISLKVGGLLTVERYRTHGGWETPGGFWLEACAEWKFLGIRDSLYAGGKQFRLYEEFGSLLYQGEPYYQSTFYNRSDIYARIYENSYMDLEAQLNFHFTDGGFMFYQRLMLNIELDNL